MIRETGRDGGEVERMPKLCVCPQGIEVCSGYLYGSMRAVQAQIVCCPSMNCVLARGR